MCGLCGLQHNMNTKNNKLGIAVVTMNIVFVYIELTYCTKLHCNQLLAAGVPPRPHTHTWFERRGLDMSTRKGLLDFWRRMTSRLARLPAAAVTHGGSSTGDPT